MVKFVVTNRNNSPVHFGNRIEIYYLLIQVMKPTKRNAPLYDFARVLLPYPLRIHSHPSFRGHTGGPNKIEEVVMIESRKDSKE